MHVEELVYGFKGNETYLTLYLNEVEMSKISTLQTRAGVYMVYNKENELMYIGESKNIKNRVKKHLEPASGKKELSKATVGHVRYAYLQMDRYERGVIEGMLVQKYRPALNCDDAMVHASHTDVDTTLIYDVMFYLKNTNVPKAVIAKAFNVNYEFVNSMDSKGYHCHLTVPANYTPSFSITQEFIEANTMSKGRRLSQTIFNNIRELLEEGTMTQGEIARKFNFSHITVNHIKNLKFLKYKKWEEQRTNKVVA